MTIRSVQWTRRQFSQALGAAAASTLLLRSSAANAAGMPSAQLAFVATGAHGTTGAVRVLRVAGGTWRETDVVQAPSPSHLVVHPTLPILYVVHDVAEWSHRPRGAVSAYRFDAAQGRLNYAGAQPLSLSATNPRHAVVVASGRALFVAAHTGGIYNVLPIDSDGTLQPVSAIRKELGQQHGSRARVASPGRMVLHRDGSVYGEDAELGTLTRFAVDRNAITLLERGSFHGADGDVVASLAAESQRLTTLKTAAWAEGANSVLLV